ncbi:hypothetical protein EDD36DRAFT_435053 [Exophiala viscosa]|uniref:SCP domain-containing protein n=1 Tax=Exophiala viscosa TaxID=2486360 RepID=A0AAN6DXS5_9EURO|nr:hypothetical protein EDD36DRAFT_435053 [Exophiala viscosa]
MISVKALSVLAAVAGIAVAIPTPAENGAGVEKRWNGHWSKGWESWSSGEEAATVTATAVAVVTTWVEAASPTATVYTEAAETTSTAAAWSATTTSTAATSTSTSSSTDSISSDVSESDYISVVSKWRTAAGLPDLTQDSTLEANALKTSTNSVGGLIHELNPGTMAQVLAPGTSTDFEEVYVGGWLCEIPTDAGLDGICATASDGWDYDGQTGHATILTSTSYTKIGCAISSGTSVWACDLA